MITGYTRIIEEKKDVTLEDFILTCSEAFLGRYTDRDYSTNFQLPDKVEPPSNYHLTRIKEEKSKLRKAQKMTLEEAEKEAEIDYQEERKDYEQTLLEKQELKERYEGLLKQVKAWKPPTKNHYPLKKFMIDQLEDGIDHDCSISWLTEPAKISGAEYKKQAIKSAKEEIKYNTEEWKEQLKDAAKNTEWVQKLKQNLNEL